MKRRQLVLAAGAAVLASAVRSQGARAPVTIGFLRIVAPPRFYLDAFEQGLRDRGYVPGTSIVIEYRFADGQEGDLDRLARDLVDRKVAVMVVAGNQAVRAARRASTTVPIVMAVAMQETLAAARTRGLRVVAFEVQGSAGFDAAFGRMVKDRREALVLFEDALFATERARLATLAARARLPAVYGQRNSVDDGGLMSYGPNIEDAYRNAGDFVDRILKGANPGDLPVEQPTRFELVINVRTAKALGLTTPQAILLRANEVIQ